MGFLIFSGKVENGLDDRTTRTTPRSNPCRVERVWMVAPVHGIFFDPGSHALEGDTGGPGTLSTLDSSI